MCLKVVGFGAVPGRMKDRQSRAMEGQKSKVLSLPRVDFSTYAVRPEMPEADRCVHQESILTILVEHVTAKVRVCLFFNPSNDNSLILGIPNRIKSTQKHICPFQEQHPTLPSKKPTHQVNEKSSVETVYRMMS